MGEVIVSEPTCTEGGVTEVGCLFFFSLPSPYPALERAMTCWVNREILKDTAYKLRASDECCNYSATTPS